MAIKDDIKEVKRVANSQEQFLEGIIKGEYILKKYKKYILIAVILAVVVPLFLVSKSFIEDSKFRAANTAYSEIIMDPTNQKAKEKLKNSNKNLYTLYEFRTALDSNDTVKISELSKVDGIDPILKDIIAFEATGKSDIMDSYGVFMNGYNYLKEGKIDEANSEFVKIPPNSPLGMIAKNLRHYNGAKNENK